MLENHPNAEDFEGFLRGTSRSSHRARNAQVMRHLLSDCSACRDHLDTLGWTRQRLVRLLQPPVESGSPETPASPGYDYSNAFAVAERSVSAFLAPEPQVSERSTTSLLAEARSIAGRRACSPGARERGLRVSGHDPGSDRTQSCGSLPRRGRDVALRSSGPSRGRGLLARNRRRHDEAGGSPDARVGSVRQRFACLWPAAGGRGGVRFRPETPRSGHRRPRASCLVAREDHPLGYLPGAFR